MTTVTSTSAVTYPAMLEAVDALLSAESACGDDPNMSTLDDMFLPADTLVYELAVRLGLDGKLPDQERLARHLDTPDCTRPCVNFVGRTNLPGDWDNGRFMTCRPEWRAAMMWFRRDVELAAEAHSRPTEPRTLELPSPAAPPQETAETRPAPLSRSVVKKALIEMHGRGEPPPRTLPELAERIGQAKAGSTTKSTVSKALNECPPDVQQWAGRNAPPAQIRAASLDSPGALSAPDKRFKDPLDEAADNEEAELSAQWQRLMELADPDERAFLEAVVVPSHFEYRNWYAGRTPQERKRHRSRALTHTKDDTGRAWYIGLELAEKLVVTSPTDRNVDHRNRVVTTV